MKDMRHATGMYVTRRQFSKGVMYGLFGFKGLLTSGLPANSPGAAMPGSFSWIVLDRGLRFARIPVISRKTVVDVVSVIQMDPSLYRLEALLSKTPKTIEEWNAALNANVLINASYWEMDRTPTNHFVSGGSLYLWEDPAAQKLFWEKKKRPHLGVFVADPLDAGNAAADVLSCSGKRIDYDHPRWNCMVESYPMLIYEDGSIRETPNIYRANRTVIGKNTDGCISLITTERGFFGTYEMAVFLKNKEFDIRTALNLDGGPGSSMLVEIDGFRYLNYGQYEGTVNSANGGRAGGLMTLRIPTVIAVYRQGMRTRCRPRRPIFPSCERQ